MQDAKSAPLSSAITIKSISQTMIVRTPMKRMKRMKRMESCRGLRTCQIHARSLYVCFFSHLLLNLGITVAFACNWISVTCVFFLLQQTTCEHLLRSDSWSSCSQLIDPKHYIQACVQDVCGCTNNSSDFCVCSTLSEFSRQCSHAGGQPPNWRTPTFCGNVSRFCYKITCISFTLRDYDVTEVLTSGHQRDTFFYNDLVF